MMSAQETQPEHISDRELALHRWRYREGRRMGMTWFEAKFFAESKLDIEEMRWFLSHGCTAEQFFQIRASD